MYHFYCTTTGEIAADLREVLHVTLFNLTHFRFLSFWRYSRRGF